MYKRQLAEAQTRLSKVAALRVTHTRDEMLARIDQIARRTGQLAAAYHRNFTEVSDDDLQSLLEELEYLDGLGSDASSPERTS